MRNSVLAARAKNNLDIDIKSVEQRKQSVG
jgi:hypothetical protein